MQYTILWYTPEMADIKELAKDKVVGVFLRSVDATQASTEDEQMGLLCETFCSYYGLADSEMEDVCIDVLDPSDYKFNDPRIEYAIDFEGDTYYLLNDNMIKRD